MTLTRDAAAAILLMKPMAKKSSFLWTFCFLVLNKRSFNETGINWVLNKRKL